MAEPDYEYQGLMAQAWDVLRGDTSHWPDRFFYLDAIGRYGQPVLDVGCGTGRLLLDYLAQGIDVDGVDNSPEMLALCSAKAQALGLAPQLYAQTMETLALPRTYRTIIIPSSTMQLIVDPAMADEATRRPAPRTRRRGPRVVHGIEESRRPAGGRMGTVGRSPRGWGDDPAGGTLALRSHART